jgi:diacylglycerol kinase (ATP)
VSGIGIITNPNSKLNKRNPKRKDLLAYILGKQGDLEITSDIDDIKRVATQFKREKIDILAINGGDGTISRTLSAFVREYEGTKLPKVVLLKGGTINVLASNLNVKGSPEQILFRLVESHSSDSEMAITTLSTLRVGQTVGFLFGTGIVPRFLSLYYKNKSGKLGAFLWAIRVWMSFCLTRNLYRQVLRDERLKTEFHARERQSFVLDHIGSGLLISTIPKMPLGYHLFDRLILGTDVFQWVALTFKAKNAFYLLPKTLLYSRKKSLGKLTNCADRATIEGEENLKYTIDGELYTAQTNPLSVQLGPKIEFLVV